MSHRLLSIWNGRVDRDEPAAAPWATEALGALDPASDDPSYWFRFRSTVAMRAMGELSRRRRAELTVGDLVISWSRTLVPATALAAAAAGFLLMRSAPVVETPLGVEEILSEGLAGALDGEPGDPDVEISFTSESF